MTPQEAARGIVELVLPAGGRVLVELPDTIAANPDVEAELVQVMLTADGSDGQVSAALANYADAAGLKARYVPGPPSLVDRGGR